MNRRGFLKNFGIGATAAAIPTAVLSQTSHEFDIDKWEDDISEEIKIFHEQVSHSVYLNKTEILPVERYVKLTRKYSEIVKYCTQEEDLPLSDNIIDWFFKGMIMYEYQQDKMSQARQWRKRWQNLWTTCGDEFMRRTKEECQYTVDTMFNIQTTIWNKKGYGYPGNKEGKPIGGMRLVNKLNQ